MVIGIYAILKVMKNKKFWQAVFLLVGTVIGAGIFSLPYAFLTSGWLFSLLGLIALTLVTLVINFFYAQVIVGTKGDHQLPGYAKKYLGAWGKWLGFFCIFFSALGAMLAYVILGGDFLGLLFGHPPGILLSLLFWSWGAFLVWGGIKTISVIESWLTVILIGVCLLVPILGLPFFKSSNLVLKGSSSLAFYGPALFSLSGLGVIPEVEELLRKKRSLLPWAIVLGILIPALVYFIFGFGILGISGAATTSDALTGLIAYSPLLVKIGALAGVLATFTSFLSLGNVLREMFYRDLKVSQKTAQFTSVFLSVPAVFLTLSSFLPLISITGSLAIGSGSLLVLLIFLKKFANQASEKLLGVIAGLILLGGIIVNLIK